jgi:hypothetical protein
MRTLALILTAAGALIAAPAAFAAEKMNLPEEREYTGTATVVDVVCELTKNCPNQCGAGKRQLGLKTPDGKILMAAKNTVNFMGAVHDLLPYCGKQLEVDGITATQYGTTLFMLQRYRPNGKAEWREANQSLLDWAKANKVKPDSNEAEEWMRNDPLVKTAVAKRGKLGVPQ